MATIQEKLHILLDKLKETDHNLSVCVTLLQQYLRKEVELKHQQVAICAVLAIAHAEESTKEKRGILGGIGYGGYGLGHGIAAPIVSAPVVSSLSLGHGIGYGSGLGLSQGYGYGSGIGLGHGLGLGYGSIGAPLVTKTIATPIVTKTITPVVSAPLIAKSYAAPISVGYSGYSGYSGLGVHGW